MFRVFYIGADDFSAKVLRKLAGMCEIVAVGTYPDKPKGRGHKPAPTPVKVAAEDLKIPVLEIGDVCDAGIHAKIRQLGADVGIVVSFRILPPEFLRTIPAGFVNLHPSLLPDLRGAAPVNWAIMLGYKKSGLTTFVVNEKVDAGNILAQWEFEIGEDETAGEVFERIVVPGARLLAESVEGYLSGRIAPKPQRGAPCNRAPKIRREHRVIDWRQNARWVHNRIRGLSPSPGALTSMGERTIKILRSKVGDKSFCGAPGEVVDICDDAIWVSCGEGVVGLVELQPEGKKVLDAQSFANGYIKSNAKFDIMGI